MRYTGAEYIVRRQVDHGMVQKSQSISVQFVVERNWMIRIWSFVSVQNVKVTMNIARIICLRISTYTEIRKKLSGIVDSAMPRFCFEYGIFLRYMVGVL